MADYGLRPRSIWVLFINFIAIHCQLNLENNNLSINGTTVWWGNLDGNFTTGSGTHDAQILGSVSEIAEFNGSEASISSTTESFNDTLSSTSGSGNPNGTTDNLTIGTSLSTAATSTTTVPSTTSSPSIPVRQVYQGFANCTCDLWSNECDTDCCCDPDCTNADRNYFTSCSDDARNGLSPYQAESCFADNWLIHNTSTAQTYYRSPNMVCLVYDNNPQRLFYSAPQNSVSVTTFDQAKSSTARNVIQTHPSSELQEISDLGNRMPLRYKAEDAIFILNGDDLSLDKLRLPVSAGFSTSCSSVSNIKFMKSLDTVCSRTFSDLPSECSTSGFLNISTYLNAVVIANPPEAFAFVNQTTGFFTPFSQLPPELLSSLYVPVQLMAIQRRDPDGLHQAFAFDPNRLDPFAPAYSAGVCSNAVTNVEYLVRHNGSYITAVEVTITLTSLNVTVNWLEQRFRVRFGSASVGPGKIPVKRSGNPGYLDGAPVLVALMDSTNNLVLSNVKLPRLDPSSVCRSGDDGYNVLFGEDIQMSCLLYVNISDPAQACQTLQAEILDVMRVSSDWPTAVSGYGNGTQDDINEINWTPVQMVSEADLANADTMFLTPNSCTNIMTGLSIEILYSKVGFLENPQSKISGLLFRLQSTADIRLQMPYHSSFENKLLPLEIQFSVTFTDLTKEPVDLQKVRQPSYRLLPYDFLSPF